MTEPVTGAHQDVGTGHEARERMAPRGPSRVPATSHAAALERIRTIVVEEHEDLARLIAARIAILI
ncbi:MAG: hypothetical protein M3Z10_10845, partial [Gemmatimonadota bacterium]|nr:hypothetical protein [Gemmatimonadota bacterium]